MSRGDDGMRYILKCKQLMAGLLGLNSGGGLVAKSCLTLVKPFPAGSSVRGNSQARILEQCSHSLLPGIFPTQGLNCIARGLQHCRQILY